MDTVARDFDLADNHIAAASTTPPAVADSEKVDLIGALKSLAALADRLREMEKPRSVERKP